MMESEVLRLEKASEAEEQATARTRLQEELDAVAALSVEREERTRLPCSIATAGGIPSTRSTCGRSMRSRNWRA